LCCVLFVIRTRVSIKKEIKKVSDKKIREEKRERTKKIEEEEKGLYCGLLTKKISLRIQILGDLYTRNTISFEHIKSLDF